MRLRRVSSPPTNALSRTNRALRVEPLEERALLAVLTVTSDAPAGPGSLAEAVELANDLDDFPGHDTIVFSPSVGGTIEVEDELVITDHLTIQGPGAHLLTLSGGNENRIFSVLSSDFENPVHASIRHVEIADGLATDAPFFPPEFAFGGGIYNAGSHVSLRFVQMVNNHVTGGIAAGGAVANEFGGTLKVSHSWFSGNSADGMLIGAGGAITSDIGPTEDGEGTPGNATIKVKHSTFEGNSAKAQFADVASAGEFAPFAGFAFGGAISNLAGNATVSYSRFLNNSVMGGVGVTNVVEDGEDVGGEGGFANGGAIYSNDFSPFDMTEPLLGRDSSLDVTGSMFVGNSSMGGEGDAGSRGGVSAGGAISVSLGFLDDGANIRSSIFRNNSTTGGQGGDGGDGGDALGGALSVLAGADALVKYSHFTHNTAKGGVGGDGGNGGDGEGGAIGLGPIVTAVPTPFEDLTPNIKVRRSILRGNTAMGGHGGTDGDGGNGNGGGFAATAGSTAKIARSPIFRNRAMGGDGDGEGSGGDGQGGGIYNSGSETTVARTLVFHNMAVGGSGGDEGDDGEGFGHSFFNTDEDDLLGELALDRLTRLLARP